MSDFNIEMNNIESDSIKLDEDQFVTAKDVLEIEEFARDVNEVLKNMSKAARQLAYYSLNISDAFKSGRWREAHSLLMMVRPLFNACKIEPEAFTND